MHVGDNIFLVAVVKVDPDPVIPNTPKHIQIKL
jgi:hypothetical protein